jgi:hypothetical protein
MNRPSLFVLSAVLLVGTASWARAQTPIFGGIKPTFDPYASLKDRMQGVAQGIALANNPTLYFDGYWDGNGNAVITSGVLSGQWAFSLSAGVVMNEVFSFALDVVNLGNGQAVVVIKWNDARSNGTSVSGIVELGRIVRGLQTVLPVMAGTGSGNANLTCPVATGRPFGSNGYWAKYTDYSSYGYMGNDGKYYCIGVNKSYWVWVALTQDILPPVYSR